MLDLLMAIAQCAPAVHPDTAYHLVQHESGGRALAIGINGQARLSQQPQTVAQAVATAKALIAGGYSVDLGLSQINSANLAALKLSVEDAFDPCKNLGAMQALLLDAYRRAAARLGDGQPALQAALSTYNTGDPQRGLRNGYVNALYARARPTAGR